MSATSKNGGLLGFVSFKVSNPINNFKATFKKHIEQQWILAKAMFLHLVIQIFNMVFLYLTKSSIWVRMELEENENKRTLWAFMIHVLTWCYLCYLRRKYFAIPKLLGFMIFNLFALTLFYLSSYSLGANGFYGDPNSRLIHQTFLISDAFFMFMYVLLQDYLYSLSGNLPFTMFPKFFFMISLYFLFDDRLGEIFAMYLLTSLQTTVTAMTCEELLLDVHREEVSEFGVLDYYAMGFLDVPYSIRMCYYGVKDRVAEVKERMFVPKGARKDKNE